MKEHRLGYLLLAMGLVVSLAGLRAVQAEESVLLRYQFTPGQVWAYDLNVTGGGHIELTGMPLMGEVSLPLTLNMNMPLEVITREVDTEGNGRLGLHLERLAVEIVAMNKTTHAVVDFGQGEITARGETIPFPNVQMAGALQNLSFVMSPRGKVLAVEGLEEFMKLLAGSGMPAGFMGPKDPAQWQQILEAYPPQLPAEPVAIGDSWEQILSIPMVFSGAQVNPPATDLVIKYTLEKLGQIGGDRVARLGLDGIMELKDVAMPMPGPDGVGAAATLDLLSVLMTGKLYLDLDAGYVHSARLVVTLNMDISMGRPSRDEKAEAPHFALRNLRLFYTVNPR